MLTVKEGFKWHKSYGLECHNFFVLLFVLSSCSVSSGLINAPYVVLQTINLHHFGSLVISTERFKWQDFVLRSKISYLDFGSQDQISVTMLLFIASAIKSAKNAGPEGWSPTIQNWWIGKHHDILMLLAYSLFHVSFDLVKSSFSSQRLTNSFSAI